MILFTLLVRYVTRRPYQCVNCARFNIVANSVKSKIGPLNRRSVFHHRKLISMHLNIIWILFVSNFIFDSFYFISSALVDCPLCVNKNPFLFRYTRHLLLMWSNSQLCLQQPTNFHLLQIFRRLTV